MDILIKSFNRPYYLDRCIQSVKKFVLNTDYVITILDDGTPGEYLEKLINKYPEITVVKSQMYAKKVAFINGKSTYLPPEIPINLWLKTIEKSSNYFVLLEDDIWFKEPIQLLDVTKSLQEENVKMLKLFWLSNSSLISKDYLQKNEFYNCHKPKVFTKNRFLYQLIFNTDKFKIRKILSFFGIYSLERQLQYYTIYSVAGVIFEKNYFLTLWKNHTNFVDENLQIKNALQFIRNNSFSNFGHFNQEIVQTSFLSAATNSHKIFKNVNLDMFAFNRIINESWLKGNLNEMENFPFDFNLAYIENTLNESKYSRVDTKEWKNWVYSFKDQYKMLGCKID